VAAGEGRAQCEAPGPRGSAPLARALHAHSAAPPYRRLASRRSARRSGACVALRWSDGERRYLCGMVADPAGVTGWSHPWVVRALSALARRWIASGVGCDARLQAQDPPSL
jgi:hypothetical protein